MLNVNFSERFIISVILFRSFIILSFFRPAGLVSAKHSITQGHAVTVYEQNEELGGVWVYTDQTGKNKYGVNVHTAMYKGLR